MMQCLQKCFTHQSLQYLLIVVAITALATAYIAEYGFKILPCDFCLYERIVYVAVLVMGFLSLKIPYFSGTRGIIAQVVILSVGVILTFYHVGMEQHWWQGPASCSGIEPAANLEEFRARLMQATRPRCDLVTWAIFGISATLWNLMLQAGLAFLSSLALYLPDKR